MTGSATDATGSTTGPTTGSTTGSPTGSTTGSTGRARGAPERAAYLCIGCPLGCRMEVDAVEGDIVEVRGFSCRRGKEFAVQEHTDPRRLVTTTVAIDGARWPRLPVRTVGTVPKAMVRDVCRALAIVRLVAPVRMGEVVVHDVLGTGTDVVATRDMDAGEPA